MNYKQILELDKLLTVKSQQISKQGKDIISKIDKIVKIREKYARGKIYKIVDNGYNEMYIGSTTEKTLALRLSKHKSKYKRFLNNQEKKILTVYNLFDKYGVENCKIELIENYSCASKEILERREGYHQQRNNCVNKNIAGRTQKEYNKDNKQKLNNAKNKWRSKNKDKRQIESKKYRETHKELIKVRSKISREKNREKRLASKKAYYYRNKAKIQEYQKNYRLSKLLTED